MSSISDSGTDIRKRLHEKALDLPFSPGVYIMHDKSGKIIYVGKSKALHNRVSHYFAPSARHDIKTEHMVSSVYDFEYILTDTEIEALALENRLIKLHTPKYNIRLKDCKSYPYIKVTVADRYPSVIVTRKRSNDKAKYFGPYSGMDAAYKILRTVQSTFGIPSCKRQFPRDIGKERPCLYSQMRRCVAPCSGNLSEEEYREVIKDTLTFLKGSFSDVKRSLTERMMQASDALMFETAAIYRDRIKVLQNLWQKQTVVSAPDTEYDVFGIWKNEAYTALCVFYIRDGCVIDRSHIIFGADRIADSENISAAVSEFYSGREYIPKELLFGFELDEDDRNLLEIYLSERAEHKVHIRVPERGDLKKLCELVCENCRELVMHESAQSEREEKTLVTLAGLLGLEVIPERIEAYDISNMGNDNITAGMVAVINGRFAKNLYRTYSIRNTEGLQDDYAAMREALQRRLAHTEDGLPDLILLDGGKGHVAVIRDLLDSLGYDIPVFGMVKDAYHKTRAISTDTCDISIAREQSVFNLIYRIQEEVHRYTVGRMTAAKRKTVRHSSLEEINGIGPSKAKALLSYFGTIAKIRSADADTLSSVKGITQKNAADITEYFSDNKKQADKKEGINLKS